MLPEAAPASPPPAAPTHSAVPNDGSAPLPDPAAAPAGRPESVQRGLQILHVTLVVSLVGSLLGGVTRTYMMDQIINHGGSTHSTPLLSMVLGAWQLLFLGVGIAQLVATAALAGAPPAARVGALARTALTLRAVELALSLLTTGLPYLLSEQLGIGLLGQLLLYTNSIHTVLSLVCTLLLVEVLLRLRRFAAPTQPAVAENEGLVRAGLWGAVFASIAVGFASSSIGFYLFGMGSIGQWATLAVRMPFSILSYGLMLWLVQAVATALHNRAPDTAMATAPAAPPAADTSAAGYRNLLMGALWTMLGIGLTVVTYENARQLGGRYVVAYGAIVAGIIQMIRGMIQLGSRR